jgi:hypothetical protein
MTPPITKQLSAQNWLQPDSAMSSYVKVSPSGVAEAVANDWLAAFLDPQLLPSVPDEIRGLFEAARGALIYGAFYYPLYMLGTAELFRVADAAVARKCQDLNTPPPKRKFGPSFDENIKWLAGQGVLQEADWEPVRHSRNFASHQKDQSIITPAMAHIILTRIAERLNGLYR